jgi:hypothetical protein
MQNYVTNRRADKLKLRDMSNLKVSEIKYRNILNAFWYCQNVFNIFDTSVRIKQSNFVLIHNLFKSGRNKRIPNVPAA